MEFNLIFVVRLVYVDSHTCTENNVENNKVIFNIRRHTNEVRTVTAVDGDPIPASLKLCTELSWHNRAAGNQSQSNSSFCAGKCSFTLRKTLLHSRPPPPQTIHGYPLHFNTHPIWTFEWYLPNKKDNSIKAL